MHRDILFRGKSKKTGEWLYGSLINGLFCSCEENLSYIFDYSKIVIDDLHDVEKYMNEFEVINNTIGQLTDCCDVDGNDIWEGDIINQKSVLLGDEEIDFTGIVSFCDGGWYIVNSNDAIPLWNKCRENKLME